MGVEAFNGTNILATYLTGDEAKWADAQPLNAVVAAAMAVLRQIYPSAPEPADAFKTTWSTDEWTLGAYSFRPVNTLANTAVSLAYPVEQLFFAGEATEPYFFMATHTEHLCPASERQASYSPAWASPAQPPALQRNTALPRSPRCA